MKRAGLTAVLVIVIIVLLGGIGYAASRRGVGPFNLGGVVKDSGENISDYSAVFLTNGQVYFGKITSVTDNQIDLTDIFYLQVNQQIQPTQGSPTPTPQATDQPNIVLVKLGEELHGPNDAMHINRDQVLFTESMKADSKVVKAIEDYKAGKR